ncbi:MAG: hypothetical protein AAF327_08300 [Cyanobacteria bacterium P01_A01_bin.37]
MKEIQIAAGCKTRIIQRQFSSLAMTYTFDAVPMSQDNYLAGTVEIKGSTWIFPKPIQRVPLKPSNTVTAGFWDTFFSVDVIPEVNVVISLPSKSVEGWFLRIGLGVVGIVVIVAIALILLT